MTGTLPVSLIVVSRNRPKELALCLAAIRKLDHPNFELIVVADPASAAICPQGAKVVPIDIANISAARNLGLAAAAGEIVAFIDDDAVPEPRWLARLTAPFADPGIAAAGGFVVGRNGISFQWRASCADSHGRSKEIVVDPLAVTVLAGAAGRAIRTEGTNCAFRRSVLCALGGFDPAFRFYLDETDVNMRLAAQGARTAIVPRARVHHAFAASDRRKADRTPTDLTEIGASTAVFLRKHAPPAEHGDALDRLRKDQDARLDRLVRRGALSSGGAADLRATLELGIAEGQLREMASLAPIPAAKTAFLAFAGGDGAICLAGGWIWQATRLRAEASRQSDRTTCVLMLFSPTARFHRLRFTGTHWEQIGGLFGRSERSGPAFRFWRRATRLNQEARRLDF